MISITSFTIYIRFQGILYAIYITNIFVPFYNKFRRLQTKVKYFRNIDTYGSYIHLIITSNKLKPL